MGRVEHGVTPKCVDFYIEERLMRSYCSNMSFSYSNFKAELSAQFMVSFAAKKDLMSKTDGPPMRVSTIRICRPIETLDQDDAFIYPIPVASS